MKFGIYYVYGVNMTNKQRILSIKEAGFDSICFLYDLTLGVEENIKYALELGLEVENLHMPYAKAFDVFSDDECLANEQIKLYKDGIAMASKYHIPSCVIHLTGDEITYPINDKGIERIRKLISYAKKLNVNLAFENLRQVALPYLYKVLDTFNDDNVGLCYDLGHDNCFNHDNMFEPLNKYGNRLKVLHLHNNYQDWDYHYPLSKGNAPLGELSTILHSLDFNCPISLEVLSKADIDSYDQAINYLKTLLSEVKNMWGMANEK